MRVYSTLLRVLLHAALLPPLMLWCIVRRTVPGSEVECMTLTALGGSQEHKLRLAASSTSWYRHQQPLLAARLSCCLCCQPNAEMMWISMMQQVHVIFRSTSDIHAVNRPVGSGGIKFPRSQSRILRSTWSPYRSEAIRLCRSGIVFGSEFRRPERCRVHSQQAFKSSEG